MSSYMRLYEEAQRKAKMYEMIAHQAADRDIVLCAMRVINRHGLAQEFVDEVSKPIQPE